MRLDWTQQARQSGLVSEVWKAGCIPMNLRPLEDRALLLLAIAMCIVVAVQIGGLAYRVLAGLL